MVQFLKIPVSGAVLRGSVVKCLTCNPGVPRDRATQDPLGFFRGSVLGQDTSEPQPSI